MEKNESIKIYFESKLGIGHGVLNIEYTGVVNDNAVGFYKTKCKNRENVVEYAAVTQFEVFYNIKYII